MPGIFSRRQRAATAALVFALFGQSTAAIAESGLPELAEAAQLVRQIGAGGGYFDDPEVNAFALPGGFIGITLAFFACWGLAAQLEPTEALRHK